MAGLYTNAGDYMNGRTPLERVKGEDGEINLQRIPKTAGGGRFRRWVRMVRASGHVVPAPLTNHSALLNKNSSYSIYMQEQWRQLGWFPLGSCPVTMAIAGDIKADDLCAENQKKVEKGKGCMATDCSEKKPCECAITERNARSAVHSNAYDKRKQKFKQTSDKMLESQQTLNEKLVDLIDNMNKSGGGDAE